MRWKASLLGILMSTTAVAQSLDTLHNGVSYNHVTKDSNGSITMLANMVNGKLHGPSVEFKISESDMIGNPPIEIYGLYKRGKKTGLWTTKDAGSGENLHQGKFKNDVPVGTWCLFGGFSIYKYDRKGQIVSKGKGRGCGCPSKCK